MPVSRGQGRPLLSCLMALPSSCSTSIRFCKYRGKSVRTFAEPFTPLVVLSFIFISVYVLHRLLALSIFVSYVHYLRSLSLLHFCSGLFFYPHIIAVIIFVCLSSLGKSKAPLQNGVEKTNGVKAE